MKDCVCISLPSRADRSWGFTMNVHDEYIDWIVGGRIHPGSWIYRCGLRRGMRIFSFDNKRLNNKTSREFAFKFRTGQKMEVIFYEVFCHNCYRKQF